MKLDIPKVIARVDLGEYAPELKGSLFCVWVNPPLNVLAEHQRLAALTSHSAETGTPTEMLSWYSALWSHGGSGTEWTVEELLALQERDPALLIWLINVTWQKRREHLEPKKKF